MDPKRTGAGYDEISDMWRSDRFHNENGVALLERALGYLESVGTCLNVGCGGNTRFNPILRSKGLDVVGLDVSEGMVALAKENDPDMTQIRADI